MFARVVALVLLVCTPSVSAEPARVTRTYIPQPGIYEYHLSEDLCTDERTLGYVVRLGAMPYDLEAFKSLRLIHEGWEWVACYGEDDDFVYVFIGEDESTIQPIPQRLFRDPTL